MLKLSNGFWLTDRCSHPTWAELYEAIVPVVSTGGAVLEVAAGMGSLSSDLADERDYVAHFHRRLGVSVREGRYRDPDAQPAAIEERFWRPAVNC